MLLEPLTIENGYMIQHRRTTGAPSISIVLPEILRFLKRSVLRMLRRKFEGGQERYRQYGWKAKTQLILSSIYSNSSNRHNAFCTKNRKAIYIVDQRRDTCESQMIVTRITPLRSFLELCRSQTVRSPHLYWQETLSFPKRDTLSAQILNEECTAEEAAKLARLHERFFVPIDQKVEYEADEVAFLIIVSPLMCGKSIDKLVHVPGLVSSPGFADARKENISSPQPTTFQEKSLFKNE
ncbi:uncharacterized protein BDR25DRAFT_362009 [Lindgomyces ingoldianus]|uniref:Uncharacterized protein n=1 Tax=Lindgomyces ingoldianus TaxID=673940 RepID=A0ACB6QAU7_9PLEO|nr:uncharacterized protein BDR25DRAFT_362009 [Lindgomyces ingoldianus]KAF2464089.1 hypothetical protein BDR25DRAFT_362009 [Lindgomyces ingoldianus]